MKAVTLCGVALLLAGCRQVLEYPPPAQHRPVNEAAASPIGSFVEMADDDAEGYIVRDISSVAEGKTWRWAYRHPEMRFFLETADEMKFRMEFTLPDVTFQETGPVTLSFSINHQLFDKQTYSHAGNWTYEKPVPPSLLARSAVNIVTIDPDKVWVSKSDGAVLGLVISRAGFVQ